MYLLQLMEAGIACCTRLAGGKNYLLISKDATKKGDEIKNRKIEEKLDEANEDKGQLA